jgi:nucleoside-diphosphate-sugar epimerase
MNLAGLTELDEGAKNYLTGKAILVTGAQGFIGTTLLSFLSQIDCLIIHSSRSKLSFDPQPPHDSARFLSHQYDRESRWNNLPTYPDIVFYLSGQTNIAFAHNQPYEDFQTNVSAVVDLCDVLAKQQCPAAVIYAGTITQAGISNEVVINESVPDAPITFYDFHKLLTETSLKFFSAHNGLRTTTIRLPNIYGPGPKSQNQSRGIINSVIKRGMDNKPIKIYGTGEQIRDYLFIADTCHAFILAARDIEDLKGSAFLLSGGSGHTVYEAFSLVCDCIYEKMGFRPTLVRENDKTLSPIERRSYSADASRFSQVTGWRPRFSLRDGINATIESLL